MNEEYVTLVLSGGVEDGQKPQRRRLWRWWKQLSRFQRNLVSMVCVVAIVTAVYYWNKQEETLLHFSAQELYNQPQINPPLPQPALQRLELPVASSQMEEKKVAEETVLEENKEGNLDVAQNEVIRPIEINAQNEIVGPNELIGQNEVVGQVVAPDDSGGGKVVRPEQFAPPGNEQQAAVVGAMQHAWAGYKKYAWGHDNLKPISHNYHDWFGLGLTIVDGLDTLYIMGLTDEFEEAKIWVRDHLNFNEFHDVNLFEVTIRVLGGLLSAYYLSSDIVFLDKAVDLGQRLMPCFTKSPSPIPFSDVNLASHTAHSPRWSPDSSTSEVTTLQLEFRALSRASMDPKYEDAAFKVSQHVHTLPKTDGLVPIFINPNTGQFHSYTDIKLGARGDSYYEYLLKQWVQTGKTIDFLRDDYLEAVRGIQTHLVRKTSKNNLLFIGELKGTTKEFVPKMDHLVCYLPGTLALGVHNGLPNEHMRLAEELMETCYRTYSERPTFLAPEITFFNIQGVGSPNADMYVKSNDAHNLLRPEFIESLWYMYQVTGNTTYQEWGWKIFQAFEKYTKVDDGYTSIGNVNNPQDVRPRDMMESFFLSETLKYLYLLFADDRKLLDIDKFVINSEAHPLPIYTS